MQEQRQKFDVEEPVTGVDTQIKTRDAVNDNWGLNVWALGNTSSQQVLFSAL